jgi:hypothetical protein
VERVVVTRAFLGICHMQVCAVADATDEEILTTCNSQNPSGTSGGWSRVIREEYPEDSCFRPVPPASSLLYSWRKDRPTAKTARTIVIITTSLIVSQLQRCISDCVPHSSRRSRNNGFDNRKTTKRPDYRK